MPELCGQANTRHPHVASPCPDEVPVPPLVRPDWRPARGDVRPSGTRRPRWHLASTVAGASPAWIEAMIAWTGIRPSAISWPPERRTADAKGAAHRFSQMSTPAVLPGSIAAARCLTPSPARSAPSSASSIRSSPSSRIGPLCRLDGSGRVLGEDQYIDHADGAGVDQRAQLGRHLTGETARARRELDDDVAHGT